MDKNLPDWYTKRKRQLIHSFENFKGLEGKYPSPKGDYTLVIERYEKTGKAGSRDYTNTYYRGIIYSPDKEVAKLHSDACHKFWHCWIEKGDKLYLLCNEDPKGYTIVNVKEGIVQPYIDPKAKSGWGFSWKKAIPSPDSRYIAVQGSYMEMVNEISVYDLDDFIPPLRKIKRVDTQADKGYFTLTGWHNDKVVMDHHQVYRDPPTVEIEVEV